MAVTAALGYAVLRRGLVVVALAATVVTVAAWAATPHPATTGTGGGPLQATINALRQERLFSCAWSAWSLHVKHTGRTLRYNSEVGCRGLEVPAMWKRHRRWPAVDLHRPGGSSVIKSLSSGDLKWLMDDATRRGWSANGRPEWFRQHEDQVRAVTLVLFGSEAAGALRCIVTVVLSDRSGGRFTLDVSSSALDALPDIDRRAVIILAHEYLATFPHIALDPDQAASWEGSAWQRWGEA